MLLIGRYLSPFTRRVAVTMKLLDIPFESSPLTAWQNLDEVRRMNPVGRVPALVLDDGEVIFDSGAILDYLDEQVGPERALTPPAGRERRDVMRLTATAVGIMEKGAAARYEVVMRPEDKIHTPWLEHNRGQIESGLNWLETQVKGSWLTGESLSQADVSTAVMGAFLRLIDDALMPEGKYPQLDGLVARANELVAFSSTDPVDTG